MTVCAGGKNDNPPPAFVAEAWELAHEVDPEPSHAEQVTRLALELFDQLNGVHQLGGKERSILEAGALLHDIGWSLPNGKHHKNSSRLIEEHRWEKADPQQVLQIAAVARYHRKAHPKKTHRVFGNLDPEVRKAVRKLAAIVRVADGLDRSHLDRVRAIRVELESDSCILHLQTTGSCDTEIWGAERKRDLFEETFGLKLKVRQDREDDEPGLQER